jgi:hypothetical protein
MGWVASSRLAHRKPFVEADRKITKGQSGSQFDPDPGLKVMSALTLGAP